MWNGECDGEEESVMRRRHYQLELRVCVGGERVLVHTHNICGWREEVHKTHLQVDQVLHQPIGSLEVQSPAPSHSTSAPH